MTELIKIIKQIINSKPKEEQIIILPIETINGLPVTAKLSIVPNNINYLFFIDIDANGIDTEIENEILPLNFICKYFYEIPIENPIIDADDFIDSFKKIVNSLRYDNKTGKIDGDEEDNQFFRELITNPNIIFKELETCCVCSEITKTKTQCNHTLCLICCSKIKPVEDKKCPICRELIIY
jgi:hypothetical protein